MKNAFGGRRQEGEVVIRERFSKAQRRCIGLVLASATLTFCGPGGAQETEEPHHARKPIPPPEELAKLPPDGGPEFNRLVFEKSPYLLQHAANPVDWHPWGEEAFARAAAEDKPVFLSIGYSTCHWCHVMEAESFEDDEVAALMNEGFISIKVDREERPDIDQIYMAVTQAYSGSGGWPMTVILTPEKKPFFAGTYFPKHSRLNRPGMMELLPSLVEAWKTNRAGIDGTAEQLIVYLRRATSGSPGLAMDESNLATAYTQFSRRFDPVRGGFGSAPKFPSPHNLSFLLRYWRRTRNAEVLKMVEVTLEQMRKGGLFDHVGFGFHRYSTDADWLLPHFEKMLYDQAMLTIAYTEAYQATGKLFYAETAREILTYVLRDMTSPEGGFYSAEDADSEGEEGKFYLWSVEEVKQILGAEEGALFARVYNFESDGNFLEQTTRRKTGTNIPHLKMPIAEIADEIGEERSALAARLTTMRERLFEVRERRVHPIKDDKILTDWNGLMIVALAKAGAALGDPEYTEAASRAADFVLTRMRDESGRLAHRYRLGEAGLPAHLEDYAYVIWGLLELYEASFEIRYLKGAIELQAIMDERFWDAKDGGYFKTADDGEALLVRAKEIYDGARPSGNSVAALTLIRIGRVTGRPELEERADALFKAFSGDAATNPSAYCQLLSALDFAVGPSYEVVISGREDAEDTAEMLGALRRGFVPNKVVLLRPEGLDEPPISAIAEFTLTQRSLEGKATAYVCRNYACKAPTTDIRTMLEALK